MNNELIILLYHGVTESESYGIENFSNKHISVREFKKQMSFIRNNCNILSMDEVVDIVSSNTHFPPNSVAVTFDDGFRNNYSVAAPILTDLKIPTTFYITSGIINTDIMFWVDELEDCINLCEKGSIKIELNNTKKIFNLTNNSEKIKTLTKIKNFCKKQSSELKNEIIQQLIYETGIIPNVNHAENYKKMNWKELRELNDNELFIIGGHSLYHDILSQISSQKKLELDIKASIALLEYNLNEQVRHYSYPEGQSIHYNQRVINCLKSNRIICSPSAIYGTNESSVDLFNLKRIMVGFMGSEFPFEEIK